VGRRIHSRPANWFSAFFKAERKQSRESLQEIADRAKKIQNCPDDIAEPNHSMFRRLEENTSRQFDVTNREHINFLLQAYDVDRALLHVAESEPIEPYIVFRNATEENERKKNFPRELKRLEAKGVTYYFPTHRVSDIAKSIAWVEIAPRGQSLKHAHRGDEIAIITEGEITYEFSKEKGLQQQPIIITLRKGDIIHHKAKWVHVASNRTDEVAKFIVIRSLSDDEEWTRLTARG